jgi:excisionase family DNA binding protein
MTIQINGDTYLDTKEAMDYLGVSRPTLDALVDDGRLKRYKQGIRRLNYYKQADLNKLLEMREDTEANE